MSRTPSDWDNAWQGLEPQQPRRPRGGYWVALAAAAFLLVAVGALGYYVLQQRGAAEPGLTLPGEEATAAAGDEATAPPDSTATTESAGPGIAPTVTLPGAFATPQLPPPASDVVTPRLDGPPAIDGDAAEWGGLPTYSSPHIVFTGNGWDGTDDLAAAWQVAWDDDNLYLIANVADDIHAQSQTGNQTFRGDSVELQIDADRAGDFGPTISPDDFQITLSPGNLGDLPPSAFRFQGVADGSMLDATTPHNIIVAARGNGGGYVLEAAIPWRDLNITPSPGLVIGLAVNVNDNDRPGSAVQEMMKSNMAGRRFGDPTTWGTLTLQ